MPTTKNTTHFSSPPTPPVAPPMSRSNKRECECSCLSNIVRRAKQTQHRQLCLLLRLRLARDAEFDRLRRSPDARKKSNSNYKKRAIEVAHWGGKALVSCSGLHLSYEDEALGRTVLFRFPCTTTLLIRKRVKYRGHQQQRPRFQTPRHERETAVGATVAVLLLC